MRTITDDLAAVLAYAADEYPNLFAGRSDLLDEARHLAERLVTEHGAVMVTLHEDSRNPAHCQVSVFTGRTEGHLAHSGTITVRADEWDEMCQGLADIELISATGRAQ